MSASLTAIKQHMLKSKILSLQNSVLTQPQTSLPTIAADNRTKATISAPSGVTLIKMVKQPINQFKCSIGLTMVIIIRVGLQAAMNVL